MRSSDNHGQQSARFGVSDPIFTWSVSDPFPTWAVIKVKSLMSGSSVQSTLGALSFQYRVSGIVERLLWAVSDDLRRKPKVSKGLEVTIREDRLEIYCKFVHTVVV